MSIQLTYDLKYNMVANIHHNNNVTKETNWLNQYTINL